MIHNYSIEVFNIVGKRWELADTCRTLDEAFDVAEKYVGFKKEYDGVSILDLQGFVIWDSNGFKQGEGLKYVAPEVEETRMKNIGLEAQQEAEYTAEDGSC